MAIYPSPTVKEREFESELDRLRSWREDTRLAQEAVSLRRQRYHVDCSDLDESTRKLKRLLDIGASPVEQLKGLRGVIGNLSNVLRRTEGTKDTYTIRKQLLSLAARAYNVCKEMEQGQRAHEFNRKALEGILRDYQVIRD
jgi:hypothetical protein